MELKCEYNEVECGFRDFVPHLTVVFAAPLWKQVGQEIAKVEEIHHAPEQGCMCPEGKKDAVETDFTVFGEIEMEQTTPSGSINMPFFGAIPIPSITLGKVKVEIRLNVSRGGATRIRKWIDDQEVK